MLGGTAFILALLGGSYLGVKSSCEKSAIAQSRAEYARVAAEDERMRQNWVSKATNSELENELEDRIYHRDAELMQELKDSWRDYYKDVESEFRGFYTPKKTKYSYIRSIDSGIYGYIDRYNAIRILMANRGFLTVLDAEIGIDMFPYGPTKLQELKNAEVQKNFVSTINRKLRDHGIDEPVYIKLSGTNEYYPLFGRINAGLAQWRPVIPTYLLQASMRKITRQLYNQ